MLARIRRVSMADVDDVLDRLRRRLPHVLTGTDRDTRLDQLVLNSLDFVELLCAVEEEFGVRLSQETLARTSTTAELAKVIGKHSIKQRKASHALR